MNGDVVSNALEQNCYTSNIALNKNMMLVQMSFHNVWTEVRKQEGLRKMFLLRENELLSFARWRHLILLNH